MTISMNWRKVASDLISQRDSAGRRLRLEEFRRVTQQWLDLDRLGLDRQPLPTFQSRHVEQILDQPPHSLARKMDDVELLAIIF